MGHKGPCDDSTGRFSLGSGTDMTPFVLSMVEALSKLVYPMFRNDPRGQAIMAIYERRMAKLHAEGTLDRIFKQDGYEGYPAPESGP